MRNSGIVIFILAIVAGYALRAIPQDQRTGFVDVLGWLLIPLTLVGAFLFWRGRQFEARASAPTVLAGSGPQVLYLRPFRSDASTLRYVLQSLLTARMISGMITEEEQLRDAIQPFGDLVAIGRPGEKLPLPGAARIYASDEEWKSVVDQHMTSSRLVIIRAGSGQGLLWEMREAIKKVESRRLLFLILHMKGKDYESFRQQAALSLDIVLPPVREVKRLLFQVSGLVAFTHDGKPIFLPLRSPLFRRSVLKPMVPMFQFTLRPVFEESGLEWRKPPVSGAVVFAFSLLSLLGVGFVTLLAFAGHEWWTSRSAGNTQSAVFEEVSSSSSEPLLAPVAEQTKPASPFDKAESRFEKRIFSTPSLLAQIEKIVNSPDLSSLPPDDAAAKAGNIAQEFARSHVRSGLIRLPDDPLLAKLELDRKFLKRADSETCAAFAMGKISAQQVTQVLHDFEAREIDQWFDVSFQALKADVDGDPARSVHNERIRQTMQAMLGAMSEEDSATMRRVWANPAQSSKEEICWTERTLRGRIAGLDRSDQVMWALAIYK